MSIIKGLSPSLSGIMPEANASMQDLSQILGDVMSGSAIDMGENLNVDAKHKCRYISNSRRSTWCNCRSNKIINSRCSRYTQASNS